MSGDGQERDTDGGGTNGAARGSGVAAAGPRLLLIQRLRLVQPHFLTRLTERGRKNKHENVCVLR